MRDKKRCPFGGTAVAAAAQLSCCVVWCIVVGVVVVVVQVFVGEVKAHYFARLGGALVSFLRIYASKCMYVTAVVLRKSRSDGSVPSRIHPKL